MLSRPCNRERGYSFPVVVLKFVDILAEAVSVEPFVIGFEVTHKFFNYLLFAVGSGYYLGYGFVMLSREGHWSAPRIALKLTLGCAEKSEKNASQSSLNLGLDLLFLMCITHANDGHSHI